MHYFLKCFTKQPAKTQDFEEGTKAHTPLILYSSFVELDFRSLNSLVRPFMFYMHIFMFFCFFPRLVFFRYYYQTIKTP